MSLVASARRAGALAALAGLGSLGLMAAPAAAPAVPVPVPVPAAPAAPAGVPVRVGGSAGSGPAVAAGSAAPMPAVPAGARFVTVPRPAVAESGVRPACATPVRPGQMMCMALVRASSRPGASSRSGAGPPPGAYDPADLREAYGLASASASAGAGQTVAVVDAFGDPEARKDLRAYRARFGLPACTSPPAGAGCLTIANQAGHPAPLPGPDPSGGWELEESLDLDMVSAICPNCSILLVEARSVSISALGIAERYAARNASAVSNSWGSGAEFTGENSFDADFNHPGVAITAAAGDSGYGTQYPAASQFVTAVGGTTLTGATSSSHGTQRAWGGTGSGCSSLEARPSWQTSADLPRAGCRNRADTDVSADADPVPGVAVSDSFRAGDAAAGWTAVGGTSVSTPIIASAYALAGDLRRGTYPSSYPYLTGTGLSDVAAGSNGGCERYRRYLCRARAGYDGPTGLGTPRGTASFAAPAALTVTVADPGTRDYQAGALIRLRLRALDSGRGSLRYASAGLPAGLRLDPADGLISGRLTGRPGTHRVQVTATDTQGGSGAVTFAIVVVSKIADRHPGTGPVHLAVGGKCLTDAGDRPASGTKIEISDCDGQAAQDWEYIPFTGPGAPGLVKIHGRCLSVRTATATATATAMTTGAGTGTGTGAGGRATLRPCNGSAGQRWSYRGPDHLYNPESARCLDDPGESRKNGTQPQLSSCSRTAGESWLLPPAPVLSGLAGKCLADPGDSAAPGTRIRVAACSGSSSQRWLLERGGTLRIRGKCLTVSRGGLEDGDAVELADCSHSTSQQWSGGPGGELLNDNSGRCLADLPNRAARGTGLVQEDCYGEPGEIWTVS
jgi:hypothetical protein